MKPFSASRAILSVIALSSLAQTVLADVGLTPEHKPGRCAIRGHCGKQSIFGRELPCLDNGPAKEPDTSLRKTILDICGEKWADGPVCCEQEQVDALQENLNKAETFIASCPACKSNFYNLFCTFTCSPDQSLFVNVTSVAKKGDKFLVTELDNLWSDEYGSGFYNSCKDVKFGASNSNAMSFIGGGAKNFQDFLSFLGKKSLFGSPFQINFPRPDKEDYPHMQPVGDEAHPCNSTDTRYKCSCVDCESSCAALPEIVEDKECHVGRLPCLSFAIIIIYSFFVLLLAAAIGAHVAYQKHAQNKHERLRLLHDTAFDDEDNDDGEIVYQPGVLNRPTRKYWLNTVCNRIFHRLGRTCARFPALTIGSSLVIVLLLSLGWLRFDIELSPERLWVAPYSDAAREKAFFDTNFGPFFRAEQAFLVNDTGASGRGPVLSQEVLEWWFTVDSRVTSLSTADGIQFDDVCYNPTGDGCVIQSVTGYFGQNPDLYDWQSHIIACSDNPSDIAAGCLPDSGLPLNPKLIFAPYNDSVLDTTALVSTWVVKNHAEGTEAVAKAIAFEEVLIELMKDVQHEAHERGLRVSFNTEVSLEHELNKSSNTDANIVVISYIIMFIYASLALGSSALASGSILRNPATALVQSRFMLGVVGIVIVLLSVSASVGLFSACGIKVTLIIAEVIPFLVLAVGVDNIFLIVHEFDRVNASYPNSPVHERMAQALGRIGPSILLSATMETVAFALGTTVGMPAVRNFAAYAAGAVLINALLQITMFVSVLALNQRRVEDGRIDCVPCIRVKRTSVRNNETHLQEEDALQTFIRQRYAPALMGKKVKIAIVTIFLGIFTAGVALLPSVKLGLDQRIAIPSDSYLIDYYTDLYDYFNSGPPVYFVTRELNVTQREHQQELCGRFSTCSEFSLTNVLEQERKRPEISYIADPAASWVDDFFLWLNPTLGESCCVDENTGKACFAERDPPWNITLSGMPEGVEYMQYLERWLSAATNADCPLGGEAAYSDAVVASLKRKTIDASHFRTYHTPLRGQEDFINSYASARRIAQSIEEHNPGMSVFPYSKHYIFFDQYTGLVNLTIALLGSAVIVCLVISTVMLGSIRTGAVVSITVVMILVDIGGAMAVWGVYLNALTLVNLVICVGIAVEFCAHIARAFQFPSLRLLSRATSTGGGFPGRPNKPNGTIGSISAADGGFDDTNSYVPWKPLRGRDARAWAALTQVGGSVFSGITITKLLGVCVLAFTRSKIFEVYYFRVWFSLVVFAALHALVFLPVALSLMGGSEGWLDVEGEGGNHVVSGAEEDLAGRRRWRSAVDEEYYDEDESDDEQQGQGGRR